MTPRREDLGSWLEGTPGEEGGASRRPGGRLGLPAAGRGSQAPASRRIGALAVDWVLAMLVSSAFFADPSAEVPRVLAGNAMATLGVFVLSTVILVATLGHTIGHRLLGLQVVRLRDLPVRRGGRNGGTTADDAVVWSPPGLLSGVLRTVLLALVIPPVIWDGDGRGMHDAAAGTVILRR